MAKVKVDKVLGLVSNEATEISANNAVPGWSLSLVECALDVLCDVLLDGELGHGFLGNFDRLLLHILRHVGGLDLSLELLPSDGRLCLGNVSVGHLVLS